MLGRPLRRAPSWVASACFCCRAAGLGAWGPGARRGARLGAQPARARRPAQAPPQAPEEALQPQPQGHSQPFSSLNILIVVIQEYRKRNTGPAGIHHIAVHVRELKAQGAQGNGAVEFHEMALVRSRLHNVPYAFVDNHFGDYILAQGALDVGGGGERGTAKEQLAVRIHGHEREDLERALDEGWSQ